MIAHTQFQRAAIIVIALMAAGVLIGYETPLAVSTAGVLLFIAGIMADRWLPQ